MEGTGERAKGRIVVTNDVNAGQGNRSFVVLILLRFRKSFFKEQSFYCSIYL